MAQTSKVNKNTRPAARLSRRDINSVLDIEGDISDIEDFSDDEDEDVTYTQNVVSDDSASSSDTSDVDDHVDLNPPAVRQGRPRPNFEQIVWEQSDSFEPLPPEPEFEEVPWLGEVKSPITYFLRYVKQELFEIIADCTNQRYLAEKGKTLNTNVEEIKVFFGVTIIMSYLGYPRIRMYWAHSTRVPLIAERISRNRYFAIRANLKLVDDTKVTDVEKGASKYWKLHPLIDSVHQACLENARSLKISIDEQMIPFWGHSSMRQYIRGKPNPCGLKNFVATAPDGLPLDFFLYQGKGDTISDNPLHADLDLGGKVIMRLATNMPDECHIYMDRYFTSIPLLDMLFSEAKCQATGTLQKGRIPKAVSFHTDSEMRRAGRGSMDMEVRDDGQVATIKWFDNKPVVLASSFEGKNPTDECRRWDKREKQYVQVERPLIVKNYNDNMGGVDFLDRVISYYRIDARTRKWTIRLIFHLVDFAIASSWIELRRDQKAVHTKKKDEKDCLDFRMSVAESLLDPADQQSSSDESEDELPPPKKRKGPLPIPCEQRRKKGTLHLPEAAPDKGNHRCRMPGCKAVHCRFSCSLCKVYLCLTAKRNCFTEFHKM